MPANDNAITEDPSAALAELLAVPVDPRSLPVRFSRLKLMSASPLHYFAACQRAQDEGETLAMRLGSGVHAMLLDQPVVKYGGRRAGKDWDKFEADHPGMTILNTREWAEANRMSTAILRHREAAAILLDGTTLEQEIRWSMLGRSCTSRPDAFRIGSHIAELKTARSSRPAFFIRDAIKMHYHGQLAFYDDALCSATCTALAGNYFPNHYIVAVEKTEPFPVTLFRLTERTLDLARRTTRLWFEQLLQCEAANEWPGYSESIVDLDAPDPANDNGPYEIEIDGKLTEVA